MPVLEEDTIFDSVFTPDAPPRDVAAEDAARPAKPGVLPTIGAAFALYNPVSSFVVGIDEENPFSLFDDYDTSYEPEEHIGDGWDEYKEILLGAKDAAHMASLKKKILRDRKYNDIMERSGSTGFVAALAAGVLDPIGMIPIGGAAVKAAKVGSKIGKAEHLLASTARVSAVGAGSVALSEAALQATQPTLDAEQSLYAIAGGALLGGILGGAAGLLSKPEYDNLSIRLKDDFSKIHATPERMAEEAAGFERTYNKSVSAAESPKLSKEDLTLLDTLGLARMTKFITPTLRVMHADSVEAKRLFASLAEVSVKVRGTAEGRALPVSAETSASVQFEKPLADATRALRGFYKEHKKTAKASGAKPLPEQKFKERIAMAMRRKDVDPDGDEAVTKAAQEIRKSFFDVLKKEAIDVDLLPEDIVAKFADSYLTRIWNPKAVVSNEPIFKEKLAAHFASEVREQIMRTNDLFDQRINRVNNRAIKEQKNIRDIESRIKEIQGRRAAKFDYRILSSVKDDYLEFLKQDIGLQEIGAYLARYGLEDVAQLVNTAMVRVPKRPPSLIDAIIKDGGIRPDNDLKARDITNKARPGLFNNNGKTIEDMTRFLIDDGFFPEYRGLSDNVDIHMIDDLRASIEEDLYGNGIYRDDDISIVDEIRIAEDMSNEASEILQNIGFGDYKNFYKNIYDDIKMSKRDLRKATKEERARIKAARQGSREAQRFVKPLLDELKRMRNAEIASLNRAKRSAEKRIEKHTRLADDLNLRRKEELDGFYDIDDNDSIDQYVSEIVDEVTNTLRGVHTNDQIPSWIAPVSRGPLKEKLLNVDDVDFEEFLENDIYRIIQYYRHHMGTQIELTRAFGNIDLKSQLKNIELEYNELRAAAKTEKERIALDKQEKQVMQDIRGVRDILLGRYNPHDPDSVLSVSGQVLRDIQFMSKMGGVLISSLPDIFRPIMVNGLDRTLPDFDLSKISKITKKMKTEDLEEMGFLLEAVNASRLQTMAEIGDPLGRGTAITRFTGNAAQVFSKVTLINYWNDMMKSYAAMGTQNRILRGLKSGDKSDVEFMRDLGIDEFHGNIIADQFKKHGYTDGRRIISGIKDWDVSEPNIREAKRIYKAALHKSANIAIVTKGAGDIPLFGNTDMGKIFLQFRNFLIASHSRVLLRTLQSRGGKEIAGAMMGIVSMVAMGMLVAAIKAEMYQRSAGLRGADNNFDTASWNKRKWLLEGIDRSGLIALVLEPLNIADKATGLGPSLFTGQGQTSRFASRNLFGSVAGPSVGTIGDVGMTARMLASPITGADVSGSDIYSARRLMPFQNAFIFRQMFDILERETGEALGAK